MSRFLAEKILREVTGSRHELIGSEVEHVRILARDYLNADAHNQSLQHELTLQHLRADIAKHTLHGIITASRDDFNRVAEVESAIAYADELIKQLKESAPK